MGIAQNSAAEFELSEEQIHKLIRSARSFRDRVILEVLYFCGLRRFEARSMSFHSLKKKEPKSLAPRFYIHSRLVEVAGVEPASEVPSGQRLQA